MRQYGHGVLVVLSIAAVAIVTGAIFGVQEVAPVLSLGVHYLFAVLSVAVLFDLAYAARGFDHEHGRLQLLLPAPAHARAGPTR